MTSKYGKSDYVKELYSDDLIKLRVKKKDERLDSYVKCLVCGAKLRQVESHHLAKHNLSINEYKERFQDAELISRDYHEEMSEKYRRTLGKERKRTCVECFKPFVTYAPSKVRCEFCQRMYKLETMKERERLRRRTYKGLDQILGTGDKTTYQTILSNGRILGAVWLEKQVRKLNGRQIRQKCPVCEEDYMLLIRNHQPYCLECDSEIVYARENEHYSMDEFVCSYCGLVVEP